MLWRCEAARMASWISEIFEVKYSWSSQRDMSSVCLACGRIWFLEHGGRTFRYAFRFFNSSFCWARATSKPFACSRAFCFFASKLFTVEMSSAHCCLTVISSGWCLAPSQWQFPRETIAKTTRARVIGFLMLGIVGGWVAVGTFEVGLCLKVTGTA